MLGQTIKRPDYHRKVVFWYLIFPHVDIRGALKFFMITTNVVVIFLMKNNKIFCTMM